MLYEILRHIRNFFPQVHFEGDFEIVDGSLTLPLKEGQYFAIEGSVLNDGVYQYPTAELYDEQFTGYITGMNIPNDFLRLVEEIEAWNAKYSAEVSKPYTSESFGGYAYTKATGSTGNGVSWKNVFAERLSTWRKI